jgi:hypothetical protein
MPRRYLDRRAEAEIEAMLQRGDLAKAKEAKDAERAKQRDPSNPNGPASRGQRRGPGDWQGLVEQRIQEAMEQGLFDNLQGEGKPLNLDEDRFVPDELKMAFRLLRSTGMAPLWVDLNKEIRADIERLTRFREHIHSRWSTISAVELEHRRAEYLARINEINGKIINYNIIAPSSHVHLGTLIVADEMASFDTPPAP